MTEAGPHEVRIGTSGWNYPLSGYGPWTGVFLPVQTRTEHPWHEHEVDKLAYYAEHFNTVESTTRSIVPCREDGAVPRAPQRGFEFSLKLFQDFTHKRKVTGEYVDVFKRGTEPLANANKLGALLCPFPASFKRDDASVDYLSWLLKTFADYRCAVELQHRSWSDEFGPTLALLNELHAVRADR